MTDKTCEQRMPPVETMNDQEIMSRLAGKQMMDREYAKMEATYSDDPFMLALIRESRRELAEDSDALKQEWIRRRAGTGERNDR